MNLSGWDVRTESVLSSEVDSQIPGARILMWGYPPALQIWIPMGCRSQLFHPMYAPKFFLDQAKQTISISKTLATWCEALIHLKRPWCWEGLKAGGKGDDRGQDGWMASLTRWTWVWVDSGSWWWTGRPRVLQFMGSKESDTTERLNWTELSNSQSRYKFCQLSQHLL